MEDEAGRRTREEEMIERDQQTRDLFNSDGERKKRRERALWHW